MCRISRESGKTNRTVASRSRTGEVSREQGMRKPTACSSSVAISPAPDTSSTVEHWSWDSLILDPAIKAQLQQLQAVIEDPESVERFGVDPPTGLLLAGPPGTGKTTVAKVLAAQARASFYPSPAPT